MNHYVSLLLQLSAAKRKLAELFQSEGFGRENQPAIAIAAHESIPSDQTDIRSDKPGNPFEKTVGSTGLFVIGFRHGQVSQAK